MASVNWGESVNFQPDASGVGYQFQAGIANPTDTERLQMVNAVLIGGALVRVEVIRNGENIEHMYYSDRSVFSASWEFIQVLREMGMTFDQTSRVRAF